MTLKYLLNLLNKYLSTVVIVKMKYNVKKQHLCAATCIAPLY